MGKLFKSWFKKKKKQESIIHQPLEIPFQGQQLPPTNMKLYSPDEAPLSFTHGSLWDDVLNGLKDHHEYPNTKQDDPDLPLSSSIPHLGSWSKIGTVPEHQNQQKQTIGESYGNNGASTHQQNKVSETFLCSPPLTPEPPSDSPPSSTKVIAPPSSAETPSSSTPSSSLPSLSPPRLIQSTLRNENGVMAPPSPTNDQVDDSEESSSGPETVGSNDMTTNEQHHQQQKSRMEAAQQQDTQQHRFSSIKSPSIASSHENNQNKRNNHYLQATGVSMSRMKERHRQECRRSMQSPSQQQLSSDNYLHPPSTPHHHPSFQSNPLLSHQQQQQQQHTIPQQHHHLIASPSMPSIYPVESMSPPLQALSQQHYPIPAAANSATSYSLPPPRPANTMSMARSSSLMTDIHYQQHSTPGANIGTMAFSPLANDLMHTSPSWRHQPLFPYQSDIILPPYSPSQLGTFQQQQQMMQSPYRIKQTLLPRSASVYGNVNQYHYKHNQPHDIRQGPGGLLRSPTMDFNGNRKSMSTSTRPYQPQLLSLSTQPPSDNLYASKKQHSNGSISPQYPSGDSLETSAPLPTSFLPSSSSPSKGSTPSYQQQQQQQKQTPLSSSSSSIVSSACTTPTNIDQKFPGAMLDGGDDLMDDTKDMKQVVSRRASSSKSSNKSALTEKQKMPSPTATAATAAVDEEEPRRLKKKIRHRHQHRHRRRFSLPTTIPTLSLSRSSSNLSLDQDNEKVQLQEKSDVIIPTLQNDNHGKLEIENDPCQHHRHHQSIGFPSACPTTTNTNGMHLCTGGICSSPSTYASPTAPCCPTPLSCQQSPPPHHHHNYHHPHQHYVDHSYPCAHTTLPPPPCCPPPSPPSCCPPRSHHHHHRHHRSHHRHHHHQHNTTKQQMRKSKSCMTKAAMDDDDEDNNDEDDTMTIGSAIPRKSAHGTKKKSHPRRKHHHHHSSMMPISRSMMNTTTISDDDHTVNGDATTNMKKSITTTTSQKPFLRSLLPRAPRFTSLPRALQDQQQQKTKLTTSKSSYSWMPSIA